MILADENLPETIYTELRAVVIEVYPIKVNTPGISDTEIINMSKAPQRIILTEDKDFGEWVFAHNEIDISVILLRYEYLDRLKIIFPGDSTGYRSTYL